VSLIRGRFQKEADEQVKKYTASINYDWQLFPYDIAGSIAHARMLVKQGIIPEEDGKKIVSGLKSIQKEFEKGTFELKEELEDVHMAIEARLTDKIGSAGARLHTARSRNDQVATDLRLYLKDVISQTITKIKSLQGVLLELAEANREVILPGYTHLQRAQPVLLAHHLLAYFEMFQRDISRFEDCLKRTDVLPLGSGAMAGVAYEIDREYVAKQLGFKKITANSMDAVSDRDFVIEYQSAASICMMHLSRFSEEIVLWSSSEFRFIELDDAYTTGSSIMPQKKNPDVAEIARGKTGRVYGHLMAMLTIMKGLPLTYNRDLQEDKEGLFDSVDTLLSTLTVFTGMLAGVSFRTGNMQAALDQGFLLATDIADYLVGKGAAFRSAHEAAGKLVNWASGKNLTFDKIKMNEYKKFSDLFEDDVYKISYRTSLSARNNPGGTAPGQVELALNNATKLLKGK